MPREIDFKTSVAMALSGLDVSAKILHSLIGREKPIGQHHMRYTPSDLRLARYRAAGVNPDTVPSSAYAGNLPPLIVTRMTKGGVGKTSISVNCAVALAMAGYRVLVIDADPQATASNLLGIDSARDQSIKHIGHFLIRKPNLLTPDADLPEAIVPVYAGGFLSLLPSDITLAETDASLITAMASHERVAIFLEKNKTYFSEHFDVIVVDTAPGTTPVGLSFTYAAKTAGKIVTVVEPEGSCLRALESLTSNLAEIKTLTKVDIGMQIIINRYHPSMKHVRECMGYLYTKYSNYLCDSIVPQYSGFARQLNSNAKDAMPLVEAESSSVGANAIIDVMRALITDFGITQPGLPVPARPEQ